MFPYCLRPIKRPRWAHSLPTLYFRDAGIFRGKHHSRVWTSAVTYGPQRHLSVSCQLTLLFPGPLSGPRDTSLLSRFSKWLFSKLIRNLPESSSPLPRLPAGAQRQRPLLQGSWRDPSSFARTPGVPPWPLLAEPSSRVHLHSPSSPPGDLPCIPGSLPVATSLPVFRNRVLS